MLIFSPKCLKDKNKIKFFFFSESPKSHRIVYFFFFFSFGRPDKELFKKLIKTKNCYHTEVYYLEE